MISSLIFSIVANILHIASLGRFISVQQSAEAIALTFSNTGEYIMYEHKFDHTDKTLRINLANQLDENVPRIAAGVL